jgi:predicted HTH domain antitoxin
MHMRITLELPDDVAQSLAQDRPDMSRVLLERIAIEGCRSGALSVGQAAELLSTSRNEVDGLLKRAGVYLDYTLEDLEADRDTYRRLGL